jgi:uncharacterized short protein YbdD (DUF466 family)
MQIFLEMFGNLFNFPNFNMSFKPSLPDKKIKTEEEMLEERKNLKFKSSVNYGNGDKNELYRLRLGEMLKAAQEDEIRAEKIKK